MINDTAIIVDMIIDKSIFKNIKKNAIATIGSDGLVGSMIINIVPGKGVADFVEANDVITSFNRIRSDDMLTTLNTTNQNAALLTADLLKITKEITEGKGTVGILINDTVMANDLKKTMRYLKITSQGTSESVVKLNQLITNLNKKDNVVGVLSDTVVANQIKTIAINLQKSSHEINKVVENLNATILNVKDGKGAINYLSNDPKLVKNIDSTMININQASSRLNENLEALKHNFFFKGYFKKQEKAKEKAKKKN
jgi:phospholipid/cholesterol/gamma-HCH transport system substrate-binding protein